MAEQRELHRTARAALSAGTPVLLGVPGHPDVPVRRLVPYTLSRCQDRAGQLIPALQARVPQELDSATSAGIILAVAHLAAGRAATAGELAWLEALLDQDVDAPLRLAAAVGLAWTGPAELLDRVVDTMAATLGGDDAAELAALDWGEVWLDWSEADLEELAVDELGQGIGVQVELVLRLLGAPDPEVRRRAASLAGTLISGWRSPTRRLLDALAALLRDPDQQVRIQAAQQLANAGRVAAPVVDALAAALADPTARVGDFPMVALGRLADFRCLPAVRAALQQPPSSPGESWAVGRVLGPLRAHAGELLPLVRRHLRELPDGNALASLLAGVTALGPDAAPAVPELVALLGRARFRPAALGALAASAPPPGRPSRGCAACWPTPTPRSTVRRRGAVADHQRPGPGRTNPAAPARRPGRPHPRQRRHGAVAGHQPARVGPGRAGRRAGWRHDRLAKRILRPRPVGPTAGVAVGVAGRAVRGRGAAGATAAGAAGPPRPAGAPARRGGGVAGQRRPCDRRAGPGEALATAPPQIGLVAVRCLGEIGPPAHTAVPLLQELLDRDQRYIPSLLDAYAAEWDEAARDTIAAALRRILATESPHLQ